MSDSPLDDSLAALSRFFIGDGTLEQTLQRVCELAVEAVSGADLIGITMIVEGRERTAVFTDEVAPEVDQAQYDTGEGPCVSAFHHQQVFTIESTAEDGPWPAFRRAAAGRGIGSTLSLPMVVDKQSVGAMNLYSYGERAFGESAAETGSRFASQAAIVLANAQAYWDVRTLSERLGEAVKSRAVIEQAKGILMGAQHCDADRAFALLVRASQRENVKLRDVAARIVSAVVDRDDRDDRGVLAERDGRGEVAERDGSAGPGTPSNGHMGGAIS
jgi:GAF domain-containing protein